MKRKFISGLLATLSLAVGVTACNDDSNYEYNTSSECIITAVTMGSLKREMHTKDSIGNDSTFYVSVTGALYPMTIDQERLHIYNVDSLPVGTDVKHVVFSSINTIGTYSIRSLQTGSDTIFTLSDSTDFSVPRTLTVHATDGVSKRDYLLSINVHQQEGDSMVWHKVASSATALADLKNTKSIAVADQLYLFGKKGNETKVLCAASEDYNDGGTANWIASTPTTTIRPQSVVRFNQQFYAVNEEEKLFASTDGTNWTAINTDFTANTLILGADKYLVALHDGQFYSSPDGINWTQDATDDMKMLPQEEAFGIVLPSRIDKTFETCIVVGKNNGQNVVWKRDVDTTGGDTYPWVYLPATIASKYNIPNLSQISLNVYDGAALLSGLDSNNELSPLYLSRDFGRTWRKKDIVSPQAQGKEAISTTVDQDNFIWMFCGQSGEVWRGRINRLGWDKVNGNFTRTHQR